MIRIECDKCKKDCDKFAYDITMQVIHNPTPCTPTDVGRLEITHDRTTKRFLLCAECAKQLGLPNIYADGVKFRDEGSDTDADKL
jgi:hypothetical protein